MVNLDVESPQSIERVPSDNDSSDSPQQSTTTNRCPAIVSTAKQEADGWTEEVISTPNEVEQDFQATQQQNTAKQNHPSSDVNLQTHTTKTKRTEQSRARGKK